MDDIKTIIDKYNELYDTLIMYLSHKYNVSTDIENIDYNNDTLIVFTYYDKQSVFYIDISDLEEWVDNWDGK